MKKKFLILALFGDPTLPAGIANTGGFNQTLREYLSAIAAFKLSICVITDTSIYHQERYARISEDIELYRVSIGQEEHANQEKLRDSQDVILSNIYNMLGDDIANIAMIHSFYWFSGHLAKRIKEEKGIPYIHTPISLSYNKISTGHAAVCPFQVECERSFLPKADLVLAITSQEAKILSGQYHINEKNIVVTGRSVDEVFHTPARDDNGVPRNIAWLDKMPVISKDTEWWTAGAFLYIGRMVPIKGVLQIVQAWDTIRKSYGRETPPLWLVGGSVVQISDLRQKVLESVPDLPRYEMQHEVVWWGYLDQASISALFLKTLALVTHSMFEPGGRVVLEAMCQGRPVIATPNGFAADYVKDWANGFLVTYGDCNRLSRCMEYFIRQPYLSCAMGNAAKNTFMTIEHDWNYVGVHRNIYEHYLNGTPLLNERGLGRPSVQFTKDQTENVVCYPYYDTKFSETEWEQLLSAHFQLPISNIKAVFDPENNARHYVFEAGETHYRVKQFYNRLNSDAIWNGSEMVKVYPASEQIYRAAQSQQLLGIVPLEYYSAAGSYYILQELEFGIPNPEELYSFLDTFSASPQLSASNWQSRKNDSDRPRVGTLSLFIEELATASRTLGSGSFKDVLGVLPLIRSIEAASRTEAKWGFNYGKSLSGHVLLHNNHLVLLPTGRWYFGELGRDYIHAAFWLGEKIHALPGQSTDVRQHLWLLATTWQQLLRMEWRGEALSPLWKNRLSQALKALKLDARTVTP